MHKVSNFLSYIGIALLVFFIADSVFDFTGFRDKPSTSAISVGKGSRLYEQDIKRAEIPDSFQAQLDAANAEYRDKVKKERDKQAEYEVEASNVPPMLKLSDSVMEVSEPRN